MYTYLRNTNSKSALTEQLREKLVVELKKMRIAGDILEFSSDKELEDVLSKIDKSKTNTLVVIGSDEDLEMLVGQLGKINEDLAIGFIPIDSVHSPVRKVNFAVEAARLGQMTDYDKLTIEVWTNGAISPADAIGQAAKLLKDHMTIFINFEELPEQAEEPAERAISQMNEVLNRSVEELELSVRSYNCLKNANIQTISDLVQKTEAEMLRTPNFGRKSLNEIKEVLAGMGLHLGMDVAGWPPENIEELAKRFEEHY